MPTKAKNFFNIEDNFFIIDSEHLGNVKSKLYGYCIQENGIYEEENRTETAMNNLNGCGVYVYVEKKNDEISIYQDFNGSYGIYFYKNSRGGYYTLSNSFFRLSEYLRTKERLTLNRDYANHILNVDLASLAYSETMINEITMLPKNAIVRINIDTKEVQFDYIDYGENSLSLNSEEGMKVLDGWFCRWTKIFRNVCEKTSNILMSLSGGMDSRLTFLLMLKSGVDLNGIYVHSINDKLHTHAEDFEIASQIAKKFDFQLNTPHFTGSAVNYSLKDIINLSFYAKLTFHKQMQFRHKKFENKRYLVGGLGGESIRAHWDVSAKEFINENVSRAKRFSPKVAEELSESTKAILKNACEEIEKKCSCSENTLNFGINIHREVRCRAHFGKGELEDYFANQYHLAPLLDPDLRKIYLCVQECQDNNLLMAMIYVRYCPELLEFSFEGNREISKETIQFAQEINKRFPIDSAVFENSTDEKFSVLVKDDSVSELLERNNQFVPIGMPDKYLKKAFDSTKFRKLFAAYFDEELYHYANSVYNTRNYYPMTECYADMGVVAVLKDIMISEGVADNTLFEEIQTYADSSFSAIEDTSNEIFEKIKDCATARIDLEFIPSVNTAEDSGELIEIVEISDSSARIVKPKWMQEGGKSGLTVTSCACLLDVTVKVNVPGKLGIMLRSKDMRDKETVHVPFWVDYIKFNCNERLEFEDVRPAWHDKPLRYLYSVSESEHIRFHVEWRPHIDYANEQRASWNNTGNLFEKVKNHITARMDFKFNLKEIGTSCPGNAIEIMEVSDSSVKITRPKWLQEEGTGFVMTSYACAIDLTMKINMTGKLELMLRGIDVRDKEEKRIPFWIDYMKLQYNNMLIFDDRKAVCHDKSVLYSWPVAEGECIRFHMEWEPHIDYANQKKESYDEIGKGPVIADSVEKKLDELNVQMQQMARLLGSFAENGDKANEKE